MLLLFFLRPLLPCCYHLYKYVLCFLPFLRTDTARKKQATSSLRPHIMVGNMHCSFPSSSKVAVVVLTNVQPDVYIQCTLNTGLGIYMKLLIEILFGHCKIFSFKFKSLKFAEPSYQGWTMGWEQRESIWHHKAIRASRKRVNSVWQCHQLIWFHLCWCHRPEAHCWSSWRWRPWRTYHGKWTLNSAIS